MTWGKGISSGLQIPPTPHLLPPPSRIRFLVGRRRPATHMSPFTTVGLRDDQDDMRRPVANLESISQQHAAMDLTLQRRLLSTGAFPVQRSLKLKSLPLRSSWLRVSRIFPECVRNVSRILARVVRGGFLSRLMTIIRISLSLSL